MNSLNKVLIIGNLTRDPEMKTTANGQFITTVGIATNRYWTDSTGQKKDEAEFHNVVMWGKLAEISGSLLRKGMKVFFEGRLQTRSWEDEAGIKHFRTEIVARDMMILSPRGDRPISDSEIEQKLAEVTQENEGGEISLHGTEI